MNVFVETLTGKHITIEVENNDLVKTAKEKIQVKDSIPINQQHMLFVTYIWSITKDFAVIQ